MASDDLPRQVRGAQLGMHLLVGSDHAWEVHHLPKTDDARPGHGFGYVLGADGRPGSLQPRRRRDTRRHLHINVNGLAGGLVHHQLDAFQSKDIRDLMRVNEHAGRAVRKDCPNEFADRHHA